MAEIISLYEKPKLKSPVLVAAWPGMGNVAILAVDYLRSHLGAKPLGELASGDFFAPTGATVTKKIIGSPEIPTNLFYYYTSHKAQDIIFFIGSVQPVPHREYDFAKELLKVAKLFDVKMIYTTAAAPTDMYFKDEPRVFAVPTSKKILDEMRKHPVHFMSEGNIAGMNGLLISVANERKIQGVCLLGEIPFFTAQIEFPKASYKILEVLTKILGAKIDLVDLELYAAEKEKEIEPLAALLTKDQPDSDESSEIEGIIPKKVHEEEKVPRSVRNKIEKLFKQAEFDRTYKSKMRLKEELDRNDLFDDYLDRFLDLFKKGQGES